MAIFEIVQNAVLDGKESACSAGDLCSIPKSGRSLGERNGNHLQYSCLEKSMNRDGLQSMGSQSQTQVSKFPFQNIGSL